jgi:Amt family ammonium transporter
LWFGWFGFNAGSTLIADASIGRIAVNTVMAPAAGALTAMVSMWFIQGRPDIGITLNGALGGLVGVTACCATISPAAAVVVGLIAGILTTVSTIALERVGLDDAVGAVPVHLVNGWWGTLAVALFDENGFKAEQLGIQALGTFAITGTSFVLCFVIFKVVDRLVGLRASDTEQIDGLDFSEHSANAYADFQTTDQS